MRAKFTVQTLKQFPEKFFIFQAGKMYVERCSYARPCKKMGNAACVFVQGSASYLNDIVAACYSYHARSILFINKKEKVFDKRRQRGTEECLYAMQELLNR